MKVAAFGARSVGRDRDDELGRGGRRRRSCFIDAMLQTCVLDVSDVQEFRVDVAK
jgi:hypothetical protein